MRVLFGVTLMLLILIFDSSGHLSREAIVFHSGGTDKCGCHYDKKTGKYHCHKRKQRGGDCPD